MNKKIISIAVFMALLIISLPICFSAEMNLIYDANGNLITGDGKFREYNSLNQLWRVRNGSSSSGKVVEDYMYHPVEERILVKRTFNSAGSVIERVYYLDENFVRVVNSSGTFDSTYVYHEGQLVAQVNPDGTKYFVHGDLEGSTSVITNASGKAIENSSYSPFGELLTGGSKTRYDYEGQEYDSVVGDYDFNARKYNPTTGQFIQPDTIIQDIYDPQLLNRYSFERNNPYKNKDETGHEVVTITAVLLAIAVYAIAAAALTAGALLLTQAVDAAISKIPPENIDNVKESIKQYFKAKATSNEMTSYYDIFNKGKKAFQTKETEDKNEFIKSFGAAFVDKFIESTFGTYGDVYTSTGMHGESIGTLIVDRLFNSISSGGSYQFGTSGVSMSSSERQNNIQTISSGDFEQIHSGVYSETYYEERNGITYEITHVVYI